MREIKFRAYDKKWKRWILPEDITYYGGMGWSFERRENPEGDIIETTELKHGEIAFMQYTGLKDKNGKEIYEGDIVKYQDNIYKANCRSGCFMLDNIKNGKNNDKGYEIWDTHVWHTLFDWRHLLEIIGNIYEKKEKEKNEPAKKT